MDDIKALYLGILGSIIAVAILRWSRRSFPRRLRRALLVLCTIGTVWVLTSNATPDVSSLSRSLGQAVYAVFHSRVLALVVLPFLLMLSAVAMALEDVAESSPPGFRKIIAYAFWIGFSVVVWGLTLECLVVIVMGYPA